MSLLSPFNDRIFQCSIQKMKKLLFVIVVVVVCALMFACYVHIWVQKKITQELSSADIELARGNEHLRRGEYMDAIDAFNQALVFRPNWQIAVDNIQVAKNRINREMQGAPGPALEAEGEAEGVSPIK